MYCNVYILHYTRLFYTKKYFFIPYEAHYSLFINSGKKVTTFNFKNATYLLNTCGSYIIVVTFQLIQHFSVIQKCY